MKKQINELKRMQLIAGLITESEYRQSLSEEMELPKVGDKFSYEGDEIQITGVDDKFVDAKSTKKDKTYNFGLRAWKEGFKGSKLNEMDEAEKMDEAEIKEEEKGLPFLLAKTWLNEYNGNIQFAVRTEEIIGFLYNLRNEEFKQYKGEIERMYLPYKKAKDAFEKLWDEASVYSDKDLKD